MNSLTNRISYEEFVRTVDEYCKIRNLPVEPHYCVGVECETCPFEDGKCFGKMVYEIATEQVTTVRKVNDLFK
jgi:hypothetical protein